MKLKTLGIAMFFCLFMTASAFARESGSGTYQFNDKETGKAITVWYYIPPNANADTPVVLSMHGGSRKANTNRDNWLPHAEKYNLIILSPCFSREEFPGTNNYGLGNVFQATTKQEIQGETNSGKKNPKSLWSFMIPDRIFTDFTSKEKLKAKQYYLYGHSGGGQFVHRMLLFVPQAKAKMAIISSPGWYTMPDMTVPWHLGLKGSGLGIGDVKRFLGFPLTVLLGEKDNDPNHPELRHTPEMDKQGLERLARGNNFFAYGQKKAKELKTPFAWRLQIVPDATHDGKMKTPAAAAIIAADIQVTAAKSSKRK